MAIRVTCSCGKVLQARDQDAGRQAKCPACGKLLTLPGAEETEEPPRTSKAPSGEQVTPKKTRKLYTCSVCEGEFPSSEVYDDNGTIICKTCHASSAAPPSRSKKRSRDRFGEEIEDEKDERRRARAKEEIPNYMVQSILLTVASAGTCFLTCCLPIPYGVVPLIFSMQVDSNIKKGDYREAEKASENAKLWCIVALILVCLNGAWVLLNFFFGFINVFAARGFR